ncbi:hypothetical protein G7Y79_00010g028170 [Physcia stellaris]|nr:hypothetical protein G7Y79_00010g028170 [Physcia stellaris]
MRSISKSIFWTASLLLLVPSTDATSSPWITLSSFQQISGFSSVCAKAYNTPLTQCTEKDFAPGRACSLKCVEQLEGVSALINTQCKGTKAYPDTLIGMFFTKAGVSTLCPNVLDSTGGSGGVSEGESSQSTMATSTSNTLPQTIAQTTTTEISSTSLSTTLSVASSTPVSSSTPSASSAVSTTSSSATSETQEAEPTLNPSATLTQSRLSGIGSSIVLAPSSTSSSASATASSSQDRDNNRNGGGGSGGTPFDISSASNRNIAHMSWVIPSLVCLLTGMWLV